MKFRPLGTLPLVNFTAVILLLMVAFALYGTTGALERAADAVFRQVSEQKIDLATKALLASPFLRSNSPHLRRPIRLRPMLVDHENTLVFRDGEGDLSQLPDACYLEYDSPDGREHMEVCAAFADQSPWVWLAIDYCADLSMAPHRVNTHPARGAFIDLAILRRAAADETKPVGRWVLVAQNPQFRRSTPASTGEQVVTSYAVYGTDGTIGPPDVGINQFVEDKRFQGEVWPAVPSSNRCLNARGKVKQRLRVRLCGPLEPNGEGFLYSEPASLRCTGSDTASREFAAWARSLEFQLSLRNERTELIGTESRVSARHGLYEAIDGLVAPGETLLIGAACAQSDDICGEHISTPVSAPLHVESSSPASYVEQLKDRLVEAVAALSLPTDRALCKRVQEAEGITVCYQRAAAVERAQLRGFITDLSPYLVVILSGAVVAGLVIYFGLGLRVKRFVAGMRTLRRADDVTALDPNAIPYRKKRHEIGSIARTVGELVDQLAASVQKEREVAKERAEMLAEREERIKHEYEVNHIIAHEIKTPVHSLLNRITNDTDLRRIETALEAIDRIGRMHDEHESAAKVELNAYVEEYVAARPEQHLKLVSRCTPLHAMIRPELTLLVLDNLIQNAERFRDDHTEIELIVDRSESTGAPALCVKNYGSPIPVERLAGIFKMGHSDNHNARRRRPGNRGIGLFISRYYMTMQGGRLEALASLDGAVFRLAFQRPEE